MGKPLVATGSKPVGGVLLFSSFTEALRHSSRDEKHSTTTFTGVAQRQRAGLITPRSLDRNELPVLNGDGAEEARGAHNSEVTRSKRVAGIR